MLLNMTDNNTFNKCNNEFYEDNSIKGLLHNRIYASKYKLK